MATFLVVFVAKYNFLHIIAAEIIIYALCCQSRPQKTHVFHPEGFGPKKYALRKVFLFFCIGHLSGPRFGDFAHSCVRMERLESAKTPTLGSEKCPMIPTLALRHDKQYNINTEEII